MSVWSLLLFTCANKWSQSMQIFQKSKSECKGGPFPVLAMRLGLFTLRNGPTTHGSEITFVYQYSKKGGTYLSDCRPLDFFFSFL